MSRTAIPHDRNEKQEHAKGESNKKTENWAVSHQPVYCCAFLISFSAVASGFEE
jgi:hypothetical protein